MTKQFFGEATDKKQLTKETGEMLKDRDALLEYIQSSFQEQQCQLWDLQGQGLFKW